MVTVQAGVKEVVARSDTPPTESLLTVSALVAADEVLIVLEAHYLALRGLAGVMKQIASVQKGLNPSLKIAGILPTKVQPHTNVAQEITGAARDAYPKLLWPLSVELSVRHIEASAVGKPIVLYDPKHQGALTYQRVAERFV